MKAGIPAPMMKNGITALLAALSSTWKGYIAAAWERECLGGPRFRPRRGRWKGNNGYHRDEPRRAFRPQLTKEAIRAYRSARKAA